MSIRLVAEKLSAQATRWIAVRWGETFPLYYISEHPKSGGTWLAKMVSDYLQLPFPQHSLLPVGFSGVIQNHWRYHPALQRVLYLYRDGRDVMASLYFDRIRVARHTERPGKVYVRRTYERLLGKDYDPGNILRHLPRFIEFEFAHPGRGTPLNWRDHVEDWYHCGESRAVTLVSYEDLRRDCVATLGRVLEAMTGQAVDPWRLETTVEKMSMRRQTGRDPGQTDITQHIRKGVVGDWRNHFSKEAAEIFNELAGATLVRLGYETDEAWVDRYEYPTS